MFCQTERKCVRQSAGAASQNGVASLDRALAILSAFRPEDEHVSLADLARRTTFYKSTILRLLATLERRRYVVRLASGTYRLGPAVLHLGMTYQRSFRLEDHVLPAMRKVSKRTHESVSFYMHEGSARVCLFRIDSPLSVRENHTRVGDVNPVARGPAGRLFTAFRDGAARAKRDDIADLPYVDVGGVFPELGEAVAPVFGLDGALVGLLAISGPKERITRSALSRMSRTLIDAVREMTAQLGGDPRVFDLRRRATP
jgi:DNA-binding IclR family transcriptional regulator